MGYSMDKNVLHILHSDKAADLRANIEEAIVKELDIEIVKNAVSEYNTDGMTNVALFLSDCLNKHWRYGVIEEYVRDFIPKFEKYIEVQRNVPVEMWVSQENKTNHIEAYEGILQRLNDAMEFLSPKLKWS